MESRRYNFVIGMRRDTPPDEKHHGCYARDGANVRRADYDGCRDYPATGTFAPADAAVAGGAELIFRIHNNAGEAMKIEL